MEGKWLLEDGGDLDGEGDLLGELLPDGEGDLSGDFLPVGEGYRLDFLGDGGGECLGDLGRDTDDKVVCVFLDCDEITVLD